MHHLALKKYACGTETSRRLWIMQHPHSDHIFFVFSGFLFHVYILCKQGATCGLRFLVCWRSKCIVCSPSKLAFTSQKHCGNEGHYCAQPNDTVVTCCPLLYTCSITWNSISPFTLMSECTTGLAYYETKHKVNYDDWLVLPICNVYS